MNHQARKGLDLAFYSTNNSQCVYLGNTDMTTYLKAVQMQCKFFDWFEAILENEV